MSQQEISPHKLTWEEAVRIPQISERIFAIACLTVGCELVHQIRVGNSIIDFLVTNPKQTDPDKGILVEVTECDRGDINKRSNKTGLRKKRQLKAMEESGYRHVMLYRDNLHKIETATRKRI